MQDVGHPTDEAFGDVLASCRGPAPECRNRGAGHLDVACAHSKQTVRFGMGVVVRDLSASSQHARQRGAVSLSTGRLMDQFLTYTPSTLHGSIPRRANGCTSWSKRRAACSPAIFAAPKAPGSSAGRRISTPSGWRSRPPGTRWRETSTICSWASAPADRRDGRWSQRGIHPPATRASPIVHRSAPRACSTEYAGDQSAPPQPVASVSSIT